MQNLEALLIKFCFVKRDKVDHDFGSIENLIGFALPADYKFYLDNYEPFEGDIGEQYISLYSVADLIAFNSEFNTEEKEANTILIGSNGASESIGIRFFEEGEHQVVIAQYITDIDDHIEVGDSFTDTIKRLENGQVWFS